MKYFPITAVIFGLLSVCASGQNSPAARLAPGTYLRAELSRTVDAKKAKAGDEVITRITDDIRAEGKVVVREGAKLIGHLIAVQPSTKESPESRLALAFDKIVLKSGEEIPINGEIQLLSARGGPPAPYSVAPAKGDSSIVSAMDRAAGPVETPAGVQPGLAAGQHAVNEPVWAQNSPGARQPIGRATAIDGLFLASAVSGTAQVSIVSSPKHNVKLEQGYEIEVRVGGSQPAPPDATK